VFAVWAVKRSLPAGIKTGLTKSLAAGLETAEEDFVAVGGAHGRRIGLTDAETRDFLAGFNYRLGEREKEAVERFVEFVRDLETVDLGEKPAGRH
jgi:predicted solute-binding protein